MSDRVHLLLLLADASTMKLKIAMADDHALVRQGLRRYLEMAGDIQVVGEASNGREVLSMMDHGSEDPDIVLLDVRMPEMDGLEAARKITQRHPSVGIIMLSAYDDRQFVVEAIRAGARGYVLKASDAEHLMKQVQPQAQTDLHCSLPLMQCCTR